MNTHPVVNDRIIRAGELTQILGVSKATLWRMRRRDELPAPLRISAGVVGWRASTIAALFERREREAAGDAT